MNNYDLSKEVGLRIKRRRNNISMTMEELSNLVGVSTASISKIEAGISVPRALTLYMLASALRCTPNDLFPPIESVEIARIQVKKTIQVIEHDN